MRKFLTLLTCYSLAMVVAFGTNSSKAQVVVSLDSTMNIQPDAVSKVVVSITGNSQNLSLFGYEFRLSPLAGTSSSLSFLEEDGSFLSDSDYVFFGNSIVSSSGDLSGHGSVSTSVLPDDTFSGGDSTANFEDVSLNDAKTLVEMFVLHDSGAAGANASDGDQFSIELVPLAGDSSAFLGGTSRTGFVDATLDGIDFSSNLGTFVVAVPEPVASVVLSLALLPMLARRRRQS